METIKKIIIRIINFFRSFFKKKNIEQVSNTEVKESTKVEVEPEELKTPKIKRITYARRTD